MTYQINRFKNKQELLRKVAEAFVRHIINVLSANGQCRIVLGGGRTPVELNSLIVEKCNHMSFDWSGLHIYFSDERNVPEDHHDNTASMIRNTMATPLGLPLENVHPIPTCMEAYLAAEAYNQELISLKNTIDGSLFHLSLLGLGLDGHTASIFPGSPVLQERTLFVVPGGKGPEGLERVTLTKPALEHSDLIWIIAAGKEKMLVIDQMINGPWNPNYCPVQVINHEKNQVVLWLCE